MKTIGTNNLGYAEQRNFAGIPFINYTFKKVHNLNLFYLKLWPLNSKAKFKYYKNNIVPFSEKGISFYHFFNAISNTKKPWITTFETSLPRFGHLSKATHQKGLDLILAENCKKLIAFSNCTAQIQQFILRDYPKIYQEEIAKKIIVLHPPQQKLISSIADKPTNTEVEFTFIGNGFFFKGGKEMLLAFQKLKHDGFTNWKLNIVSSLSYGDYVTQSTKSDAEEARQLIDSMKQHITYHSVLPNKDVLDILIQSDVLLLPSFSDTFGYVVLEAQAAGCAIISTNVRALPEINNEKTGWVIDLPKNELGILKFDDKVHKNKISNQLTEQLITTIKEVLDNPNSIKSKAQQSLLRIEKSHSINKHKLQLELIYNSIN